MPFRKISDVHDEHCKHPEHNPPMHIALMPGVYEYKCPKCGKVTYLRVQGVTNCSHKFVDSKNCLKCGWVAPRDMALILPVPSASSMSVKDQIEALLTTGRLNQALNIIGKPSPQIEQEELLSVLQTLI
jgi:predicted RNA-binding Zn-ribbon protein involved in translation (DUF1610 family)